MFIEILKAALYGILEGITEWLPVSSTGHMILFEEILPMKVSENFWNVFLVVIQPVSYTHLDVYKRQVMGRKSLCLI